MPRSLLSIRLFGPPEFLVNGEALPRLKTRKGLYLLALLALRPGREVDRHWLAGTLWPESEETTALTYLRQSLTDLRRALGAASPLLQSASARTLRLEIGDGVTDIDSVAFQQCLQRDETASLEQAIALYRGPLLEGWAEEWLLNEREACAQSYLAALETLSRKAWEAGDNTPAVRYLRLLLTVDPLRESACRSLMRALAATRDYAAVIQVYRDLRTVLRREVNADPDTETQNLFAALRAEARRQAANVPVIGHRVSAGTGVAPTLEETANRSGERQERRPASLPRPLSEFIGRMREIEAVKRALTASRLVTLTGIGGVGKTRLSIRVAEEIADDFPDGVRFVDLSPLADPEQVARTAAGVLGVTEQTGRSLTVSVCDHLRDRHLFLILDNCEHLLPECVRFTAALLQECPNVRILATSRQRLGITGEIVESVPPLTLPDPKEPLPKDKNAVTALREYEAVRLFLDRAQRVQPNLYVNDRTLLAIADICVRLDGIPLALELAAARTSALGLEQIAARLTDRFRLLSNRGASGDRTAAARQRTLQSVLDWSYDLLLPEERVLLRRLSVFAGGWTLEAAEAVVGSPLSVAGQQEAAPPTADCRQPSADFDVLDGLIGLVDHSLVVVTMEETEAGQTRYRLLETVRQYARERLRQDAVQEADGLRASHRAYFLHLVEEAQRHLSGPDQVRWLHWLEQDHDNLRAALDGCLEEGSVEAVRTGLRLAGELHRFWLHRGHVAEGRRRYATLLSRDNAEPTSERARALQGAGVLAHRQGDYAAARESLEAALAIHRQRGDRPAEATPLSLLGKIRHLQGDYAGATALLEEALALYRETGHRAGEGYALNGLANMAVERGEFAAARRHYEQALTLCRERGDPATEASILNGLGRMAEFQSDFTAARSSFEQALARNRELGDRSQMVVNLYNLAHIAQASGDSDGAERYLRQGFHVIRELGEGRSYRLIVLLLQGMAYRAQDRALPERGTRLLAASDAQRQAIGLALTPDEQTEFERLTASFKEALGQETFLAAWEEGRSLRPDQAIQFALQD